MQLDSSRRKGKSKMKIMRTIRGYLTLWSRKSSWSGMVDAKRSTSVEAMALMQQQK
jgi:hypothetical protein